MTQNSPTIQNDIPQISLNQTSQILNNTTTVINSQVIPTNTLETISQVSVVSTNTDNKMNINNIKDNNNLDNRLKPTIENIEKSSQIKKEIIVGEITVKNKETIDDTESLTEESKKKIKKIFTIILYIILGPLIIFCVIILFISCRCDALVECIKGIANLDKCDCCDCCDRCCTRCDKCCWRCLGKLCCCYEKKKKNING